jgi:hypothetical protein
MLPKTEREREREREREASRCGIVWEAAQPIASDPSGIDPRTLYNVIYIGTLYLYMFQ